MSKYRIQVNAQATVYEKTGRQVPEQVNVSGIVMSNMVNEEREYDCKQLAVSFVGTNIRESELDEKLKQLSQGIKDSMIKKGLVI